MNKKEIKRKALYCIERLEHFSIKGLSDSTCKYMPKDYGDFLETEKILKTRDGTVFGTYFYNGGYNDEDIEANLFRMMVVTEYCRQNGVII